jgi:molybdate transport system substrate-binding protein
MRFILALLCLLAGAGCAAAADLKLLTTATFQPAALALLPEFEKRTGHKVTIVIATSNNFDGRMDAGEYFDVVVMTARLLDPYIGGRVVESSATPVARAGLGVAIKQGAPLPDISGIGAFRRTMQEARSVAYIDPASGASSGTYLEWLFDKLGIAAQIKAKAVLVPAGGLVAEKLTNGEADIGLQQRSELMNVPGTVLVGPVPLELQNYTLYLGGVSTATRHRTAAEELLSLMADRKNNALFKKLGLSES